MVSETTIALGCSSSATRLRVAEQIFEVHDHVRATDTGEVIRVSKVMPRTIEVARRVGGGSRRPIPPGCELVVIGRALPEEGETW